MLAYQLKHAANEDYVIEQIYRSKRPPPSWFAQAPELHDGLDLFYKAFWILNSERYRDDGLIPWTAIEKFAERTRLDIYDTAFLHSALSQLDIALLTHRRDKALSDRKVKNGEKQRLDAARRRRGVQTP